MYARLLEGELHPHHGRRPARLRRPPGTVRWPQWSPAPQSRPRQRPPRRRGHRGIAIALIFVASLLSFLALPAIWLDRQALNTDNWTETSSELLENDAIRTQVANYLVDQIYANVDVQGELAKALPPRAKPLAGFAAGGLQQSPTTGVKTCSAGRSPSRRGRTRTVAPTSC